MLLRNIMTLLEFKKEKFRATTFQADQPASRVYSANRRHVEVRRVAAESPLSAVVRVIEQKRVVNAVHSKLQCFMSYCGLMEMAV